MLQTLLERSYRRLGPRYLERAVFLQQQLVYLILVGAIALLSLYVDMSLGEFLRLAAVGCIFQLVYSLLTRRVVRRLSRPVAEWQEGARSDEATIAAWRAAASFPREVLRRGLISIPLGPALWAFFLIWCFYMAWELGLAAYWALLVYVPVVLVICYGAALRFFGAERIVRPVLEEIGTALPDTALPGARGLPLRTRLVAALPAINVITAVVAYGLARGGAADLGELVTVVLIATAVAATVSLVLTVLLSNSITGPIAELREATGRVGEGDLDVRVPVVTTDETGELARSFNAMAAGLAERERIREAFGTYVDREVAEHILAEGTDLAGEEVEVTMMFIDIRDFTGFAERSSAPEVVATLNRLFERIVPLIHQHGGHVDKFVGDGLLAVFGAPRRQHDHADQALAAALEIDRAVSVEFSDELAVGIGLNSGPVVAGNVGGGGRLEFSVIGDAVNIAARVEAATRQTGDVILLTEDVKRLLNNAAAELEARPTVPLKGKREPVTLYAPSGRPNAERAEET
jgi:adenylate cyclase